MSSPLEVAPLVPRANKAKKKRPGFRPVGKAKTGPPKAKKVASPLESNTSQEEPNIITQAETETNDLSQEDSKKTQQPEPIRESASTEKSPAASATSTAGKGSILTSRAILARKRKQRASTAISVGFRNLPTQESPAKDSNLTQTDPTGALQGSANSDALAVTPTQEAASTPSLRDREILSQLATETQGESRLLSFCSSFKLPKRPRRRRQQDVNAARAVAHVRNEQQARQEEPPPKTPDPSGTPAVQIIDGEIVLQESSLVVAGQRRTVQEVEEEYGDVVEEDAQLAIVGASYNSFVNRKGAQRWSLDDTKKFYEGLRMLGTDFCSMEALFENRGRRQLKRKYQQEMIKNPTLVEMALSPQNKTQIDLTIFNVEVDPEAIENAKKDEPPPYIPTDDNPAKENDENAGPEWEVVEEDADEPNGAGPGKMAIPEGLWGDEPPLPQEEAVDFPEPSMDDFFHEQDEVMEDPDMKPPLEAPPVAEPAVDSISLVPTKKPSKSKRPKFRSVSRKKK
eukprot:Nitzschia sp. Nitz4//scaffold21_size171442//147204//148820//NITZ4_002188-RA/size171442-augustus-gene-0.194-mRNA-1//1//CDS//3329542492//2387//frame0